ncbi:riboflavin synthase [Chakrabartyella piscis]|uniref:riboflavin synthase n=1 Tax=Chakrabartyella piscis TaxID=2918914 RepID=UPI0029584D42|nr:riboflavin synthase [Chakrabartyella piscis]
MFTGIIEEMGIVKSIKKGAKSVKLCIEAKKIFSDLHIGDSVATNGVCLTVTSITGNVFSADVMQETLSRSSLQDLKQGGFVNLERAMAANGRFGGHMVSGHIDGVGKIISITKDDIAYWYKIQTTNKIMHYIIEKGSITIDGISLTVAKVERDNFLVSVIPHTLEQTTLQNKKIGSVVNLENDMVGKYIEKFMTTSKNMTKEFLMENGF